MDAQLAKRDGMPYANGLGTNADSVILIQLPDAASRLTGLAGVDDSPHTRINSKAMVFSNRMSAEDAPTMILKSPGSRKGRSFLSKCPSASQSNSKTTFAVPPAGMDTLLNPLSSKIGRVMLLKRSRIYNCTTSSPSRSPAFFTAHVTFTFKLLPFPDFATRIFERDDGQVLLRFYKAYATIDPAFDNGPDDPCWRCEYALHFPDEGIRWGGATGCDGV
jgi:hypothetical protein